MQVDREVTIFSKPGIEQILSIELDDSIQFVGYATSNKLTNTEMKKWTEKTGMPCIWILDMFNPSAATTIVIPYKTSASNKKVATTDYFGEIPADRIRLTDRILYFKADGKKRETGNST